MNSAMYRFSISRSAVWAAISRWEDCTAAFCTAAASFFSRWPVSFPSSRAVRMR